jgi:hypothetical protein
MLVIYYSIASEIIPYTAGEETILKYVDGINFVYIRSVLNFFLSLWLAVYSDLWFDFLIHWSMCMNKPEIVLKFFDAQQLSL